MRHDRSQAIMDDNVRAGRLRATLGRSLLRRWFCTCYSHRKKCQRCSNGDQKNVFHRQLPLFLNPTVAKAALSVCNNSSSSTGFRHNRRKQWPTYTDSVSRTINGLETNVAWQPAQPYHTSGQVLLQSNYGQAIQATTRPPLYSVVYFLANRRDLKRPKLPPSSWHLRVEAADFLAPRGKSSRKHPVADGVFRP